MEPNYQKTDILLNVKNINLSFFAEELVKDEKGNEVKKEVEHKILSDINFQIKDIIIAGRTQGQISSLVGISGKGKTQLLRILSGLPIAGNYLNDKRTKKVSLTGDVLINKEQTAVKEGDMGIVFQDYYMPEHLKIEQMLYKASKKNLAFKEDKKLMKQAVDEILNSFGLIEHKNKYPGPLSGGQKQRANIAMQLLNGSNFILMDEPFSGLDPLMIDKTTNILRQVSQSDELKTFIIVSHDLENCCAISDTVFVLSDKGREPGTGATILKEIDLISRDLAWHEDVKRMPHFHDTIDEIKSLLI